MSVGPGFLEFFILEASDYVEQLDGLLLGGGSGGPDADALQRVARALRGTATMAKIPSFADLAGAIERVGRAMHDGALGWDPSLQCRRSRNCTSDTRSSAERSLSDSPKQCASCAQPWTLLVALSNFDSRKTNGAP